MDRQVGQRLRALRLARGLSRKDIADALNVSSQQVQKYESGVNRIAASRLFDIAQVLEADPRALFPETAHDGAKLPLGPKGAAVGRMFDAIPPGRAKEHLYHLISSLTEAGPRDAAPDRRTDP